MERIFFLLDQYPVPFMPFGWLSDSIDCLCGEFRMHGLRSTDYADYTEG